MEDSVKLQLPPEDDEILALPPSQVVHPGHLWEHPMGSQNSDGENPPPELSPLEEEATTLKDVISRTDLQHEKVMKMLRANEKMLRRVLNGMQNLHVSTPSPNALSMLGRSKSVLSSRSSSVGKMDSLRSQGGMRNPRSLDADIKVRSQNMETKWDKLKLNDPIAEGKSSEGSVVTHNSSSPTIFQSYTAFDLELKEEAQAHQAERTRRKFASVRQKLSLGTSVVSTRTIHQVSKAIQHPLFDAFFAGVVFVNAIFTGLEVESSIAHQHSRQLLSDWQIRLSHYIFFILFLIELIARLFLNGRSFFCSQDWIWNWLDIAIVASSFVEIVVDVYEEATQFEGRNPVSGLKVFRIIRLTRLVKTIRLVRIFRFVVALRTLVTSILHTLKALFWALTLLGLIVYVFAVIFAQAVSDHRSDPEFPPLGEAESRAADRYFGSLPETMLSLFMSIADGVSWQEVILPLKAMDLTWVFLFLFYVSFTFFAVLNVVTGVFCQSAIENAQNDHAAVVQNILDNKESHLKKITMLFSQLGADGIITYDMLQEQFSTPAVREYFESLGLDISDAWSFFKLLDMDGGGAVEIEEFLMGCLRLRGNARAMDIAKLMFDQNWLIKSQGQFQKFVEAELLKLNMQVGMIMPVASGSDC